MIGNSLEYLEYRMKELGELILRKSRKPAHKAFGKHILACAEAAIVLGQVLDEECAPGDELHLIREILTPKALLDQAIDDAHEASKNLRAELERACGRVPD